MSAVPRLLVSIRDLTEAQIALAAGVDILDVKEPSQGSLGMASQEMIEAVVETARATNPDVPVSVACGEVRDWEMASAATLVGVDYLKLGFAGLRGRPAWKAAWLAARRDLESAGTPAFGWIAVAYVDEIVADSPPVQDIIDVATSTSCAGVLFDTFSKTAGRLFDHVPPDRLKRLANGIRAAGMLCAAAGRVGLADVPRLCEVGVDVIAVRSAVCQRENRNARVEASAIHRLRDAIDAAVSDLRRLDACGRASAPSGKGLQVTNARALKEDAGINSHRREH